MSDTDEPQGNGMLLDAMVFFPKKMTAATRIMMQRRLKDSRLRPNHLAIIEAIGRLDAASQRDITGIVPFDKSYISTTVRELIDMGLVTNKGTGKSYHIELTDAGRDTLVLQRVLFENMENEFLGALTPEERTQLTVLLKKIESRADDIIASESSEDIS